MTALHYLLRLHKASWKVLYCWLLYEKLLKVFICFNTRPLYVVKHFFVALKTTRTSNQYIIAGVPYPNICVLIGAHDSAPVDLSCPVTPLKEGSLRVQHVTVGTGRPEPSTFN